MEKKRDISFREKIRCDVCTNFLSIPPILLNDALGNICGRKTCSKVAIWKGTNYRQSAYEAFADYQSFPCMYTKNGCQELLPWGEVEEHEEKCEFMSVLCPFSTERFRQPDIENCSWKGNTTTISNHLEEKHSAYKFEGPLRLDLENVEMDNKLFFSRIQESFIIIFIVSDDERCFHCKLWSGPEIWRNLEYKIRISSRQSQPLVVSKMHKGALIDASISNDVINSSWSKIDLENITQFLGFPKQLSFDFYFDGFLLDLPGQIQINRVGSFLDNTNCDSCRKKLGSSVFVCKNYSHTLCEDCSSKSVPAPIQRRLQLQQLILSRRKQQRNLNDLNSGEQNSPGCISYVMSPQQPVGGFGSAPKVNKCPICRTAEVFQNLPFQYLKAALDDTFKKCKLCSENVECLSYHLAINHKESIHELDVFYSDFNEENHFYSFDDHIFLLSKTFTKSEDLEISLQCLESREVRYKYELKLTNSKNSYSSITFGDFCQPEYIYKPPLKIPLGFLRDILPYLKDLDFRLVISRI